MAPPVPVTPAGRGSIVPAGRGSVTPAGRGSVVPAGRGSVTPASRGSVTPAGRGAVMPAGRGSVTPAGRGAVIPAGRAAPAVQGGFTRAQLEAQDRNNIRIVIEYLNKKGYTRTESILRQESAVVDGYKVMNRAEDHGGRKYFIAFGLLSRWVEDGLEVYKTESKRLLWPIFVYSFLNLVDEFYPDLAKSFFDEHSKLFAREHADDLRILKPVSIPEHIETNTLAKAYRSNRYRLSFTQSIFWNLVLFLEEKDKEGGTVILAVLQNSMRIVTVDRTAGNDGAFAALIAKLNGESDIPDEDEGIPGHHPGSANTNPDAPKVLTKLFLGPLAMDPDMATDVRDGLDEEDAINPPPPGTNTLIEELDQKIKREPSDDAPNREAIPLPKPQARDVAMEVQKVKELRDRLRLPPRTGGTGPGLSVAMYTFHNTFHSVLCLDFSGDNQLVAAGTSESYIRVWSLEGKPLPSMVTDPPGTAPSSSRCLIGHCGPVFAVSFSPSAAQDHTSPLANPNVSTNSRYLLSSSGDKTVRLWSLDTWSLLVIYKGHDQPVWDVKWGPFGHYFLTGSLDKTARMWSTDRISPLRIFVGHDRDVDCVAWHPNNAYVFTGSSDRTVRMWDVSRGSAVRLFTGHTANLTCLSCAPSGRILASADDSGVILIWDLATGRRIKQLRGHAKGGIWTLSWSVESSILVSGGEDKTVRVWDVLQQTDGAAKAAGDSGGAGTAKADGGSGAAGIASAGPAGAGAGKKGKGKEAAVTGDQISVFPTKKSPIYKLRFTNMNLVLAGGAFMPKGL